MNARRFSLHPQAGVSLVEVMVAMVILLVGLLGLAGMMMQSQRAEMESYQRVQALTLVQDMASRINANRMAANCYAFTTSPATGTPTLGVGGTATTTCTAAQIIAYYNTSQTAPYSPVSAPTSTEATTPAAQAVADMQQWNLELKGAAETSSGGSQIGAMINARGCITYQGGTGFELPELNPATGLPTGNLLLGTGIYTISVAWQGMGDTAVPGQTCGKNLYSNAQGTTDDALRRVVSLTVRMAALDK